MTERRPALRLAAALHRAALLLHPRPFREEFGDELTEAFEAGAEEALTAGGRRALVGYVLRVLADTMRIAVVERSVLRLRVGGAEGRTMHRGGVGEMMGTFVQDLTVGVRMLVRRPVFAVAAVGTLALGIGANAAIFSVVHGVLLSPLPFPESHELVRIYRVGARGGSLGALSLPDRQDLAARAASLEGIAVYSTLPSGLLLTGGEEPVEVRTAYVSAGFFDVLGREAYLGRTLRDDEEYGDNRVVVLSHGFWTRRFGGDETIVGRSIQLDDTGFLVAGVMPPDFSFPSPDVEAWVFLTIIPPSSTPLHIRQVRFLDAVARLQDGTSRAQAEADLAAVSASLVEEFPEDNEELAGAALVPLRESMTASVGPTLLVLLGAVGLVLLIACANVLNLLLSRGVERRGELEVRRALGAGRGRLVRQILTESLVLSALGGTVGVGLAFWVLRALLARSVGLLPRSGEVGIDAAVLGFALAVTVLTALGSGLVPALRVTARTAGGALSGGRAAGRRHGTSRVSSALVASQVGLAMVVVISSGLLLRSLWVLQRMDVGFETERLVALSLTINDARYPERAEYLAAYSRLIDRLADVPGVESVGSIRFLPLRRDGEVTDLEVRDAPSGDEPSARVRVLQVSPGFLGTAGVPLLAGRDFTVADREDGPRVVIVNDALRRRHFPGVSPVGRSVTLGGAVTAEVVGVVGDVRQRSLADEAEPTVYVPQAQLPRRGMAFLLRAEGDPAPLLPLVRAAVADVDPDQPIESLALMRDVVATSTAQPRFFSLLLAGFGLLSLLLAALGIYGVVAHAVSRRVSEIGIRVALGAPRAGLLGLVISGGMRPVLVGALAGLAVATLTTRLLASVLYGVRALDPVTFLAVPLLLLATGLLACWLPARRAVGIDPARALRAE